MFKVIILSFILMLNISHSFGNEKEEVRKKIKDSVEVLDGSLSFLKWDATKAKALQELNNSLFTSKEKGFFEDVYSERVQKIIVASSLAKEDEISDNAIKSLVFVPASVILSELGSEFIKNQVRVLFHHPDKSGKLLDLKKSIVRNWINEGRSSDNAYKIELFYQSLFNLDKNEEITYLVISLLKYVEQHFQDKYTIFNRIVDKDQDELNIDILFSSIALQLEEMKIVVRVLSKLTSDKAKRDQIKRSIIHGLELAKSEYNFNALERLINLAHSNKNLNKLSVSEINSINAALVSREGPFMLKGYSRKGVYGYVTEDLDMCYSRVSGSNAINSNLHKKLLSFNNDNEKKPSGSKVIKVIPLYNSSENIPLPRISLIEDIDSEIAYENFDSQLISNAKLVGVLHKVALKNEISEIAEINETFCDLESTPGFHSMIPEFYNSRRRLQSFTSPFKGDVLKTYNLTLRIQAEAEDYMALDEPFLIYGSLKPYFHYKVIKFATENNLIFKKTDGGLTEGYQYTGHQFVGYRFGLLSSGGLMQKKQIESKFQSLVNQIKADVGIEVVN